MESHEDFSLPGVCPNRLLSFQGHSDGQEHLGNREAGRFLQFPSDSFHSNAKGRNVAWVTLESLGTRQSYDHGLVKIRWQSCNHHNMESPKGISGRDYARNFEEFLQEQPSEKPFFFWFGAHEPHRAYEDGAGLRAGKSLESAEVPAFLPDHPTIRSDLLDYAVEIEWFDQHLERMLSLLEKKGLLEDTLIVVTADNGMPFPRAKANLYEFGIHAPMAMRWGKGIPGGRIVDDLVSFIDLAPTFLELAGCERWPEITGSSLCSLIQARGSGRLEPQRRWVLSGRERHTHARPDNLGYPSRAIRMHQFLYIRNFAPERWPAGDEFHDIDACPSLTFLRERADTPKAPFFLRRRLVNGRRGMFRHPQGPIACVIWPVSQGMQLWWINWVIC